MIGTLFSLLIAAYFMLHRFTIGDVPNLFAMGAVMIVVATITVVVLPFLYSLTWNPLQRAEISGSPRIMELFRQDKHLWYAKAWTIIFPLASYLAAIDLLFLDVINEIVLLSIWVILFGITIDVIYHSIKRIFLYLSPHNLIDMYSEAAHAAIKEENYQDVCRWVDALAEMASQAVTAGQLSIYTESVNTLQGLFKHFLNSSKSISHHPSLEGKEVTGGDVVNYVMSYILQRLELVNDRAVRSGQDIYCTQLITALGKMVLAAAEYDITVAVFPLHYLGKVTRKANKRGMNEVSLAATYTLLTIAKTLPDKVDLRYLSIADLYSSILSQLEENAKVAFKSDKNINVAILAQPFLEIKELFKQERFADHKDRSTIDLRINSILEEFKALEEVMRTLPFGGGGQQGSGVGEPADDKGLGEKIVSELERLYNAKIGNADVEGETKSEETIDEPLSDNQEQQKPE